MRALVTGATGFVGGRLVEALAGEGIEVRCMVRDSKSDGARKLAEAGHEVREGNVLDPDSLKGRGPAVDIAYSLIQAMGSGDAGDCEERERRSARAFAD